MQTATVFGEWKIKKPIGTGTHGKVYEIENPGTSKCAYKIMKIPVQCNNAPDTFPKKTQEICLKEVRKEIGDSIKFLQTRDRGRYFVSYEDFSFSNSDDFKTLTLQIRMEWLMSLSDVMEQTFLTEDEILRLSINICTCLEKCREMKYVYSNLKPDNIFITPKRCKLGDFGNFGNYEPVNMNVAMRKTQEYSAPETVKTGEINLTCDTYSLGLIMYSLLNSNRLPFIPAGNKPVGINDINTAVHKRCSNFVFPEPENGSIAIRKIIAKACAFSPEARYESPSQMKSDLLYVLNKQEEIYAEENADMAKKTAEKPEKPVPVVEGIKTYAYDDSRRKSISIDKKKKILLIAIAIAFAVLVGLIIATVVRDVSSAEISFLPEAMLQNYGFRQAFSQYLI